MLLLIAVFVVGFAIGAAWMAVTTPPELPQTNAPKPETPPVRWQVRDE